MNPPSLKTPNKIWINPATETDRKNISMAPRFVMAAAQIAVSPAAGPLTLKGDLLINEISTPPIIPAIMPEYIGAFEAREIPRHKGSATKKTVILAFRSNFRKDK